jgi:hypothetical protein
VRAGVTIASDSVGCVASARKGAAMVWTLALACGLLMLAAALAVTRAGVPSLTSSALLVVGIVSYLAGVGGALLLRLRTQTASDQPTPAESVPPAQCRVRHHASVEGASSDEITILRGG